MFTAPETVSVKITTTISLIDGTTTSSVRRETMSLADFEERTTEGQGRPMRTDDDEIEITSAMIEAGVTAYKAERLAIPCGGTDSIPPDDEDIVRAVYGAMVRARGDRETKSTP